ncbi:MAG: hypothetical protein JKY15_02060 [Deltaproteobacteria bacterium]|nr:hypothetical protein [Deltaproteobacteria bacterium]
MDEFKMDETMRLESTVNPSEKHYEISQHLTRYMWDAIMIPMTVEFWESIG